ncbi:MAG: hypothetical protein FI734_00265 [SAR202 cluster bacterium]|nr:hypothetical protein [SAR202 cluster bacterium]
MSSKNLSLEEFTAWARSVGLNVSTEHLAILMPEVELMLQRIEALQQIDVAEIAIEHAIGGL